MKTGSIQNLKQNVYNNSSWKSKKNNLKPIHLDVTEFAIKNKTF